MWKISRNPGYPPRMQTMTVAELSADIDSMLESHDLSVAPTKDPAYTPDEQVAAHVAILREQRDDEQFFRKDA